MSENDNQHFAQKVEKQARESIDAISQLADQVPRPHQEAPRQAHLSLLTRDFNAAMGLPVGSSRQCLAKDRGRTYGRMLREEIQEVMLREEIQEVEQAMDEGVLHDVLAESVDVLYLTFNLIQECGLEQVLGPAFLTKHGDNMWK